MKRWLGDRRRLALAIGLGIFALSLPAVAGIDLLGWGVTASVWLDPAKSIAPVSKAYAGMPGWFCPAAHLSLSRWSSSAPARGCFAWTSRGLR